MCIRDSVIDGFQEESLRTRFNGTYAAFVDVARVGNQSAIEIAELVKQYIAAKQDSLPVGLELDYWDDNSRALEDRLGIMMRSAIQGSVLVILLLSLFLRPAVAIWVFLGIPISFIGSFMALSYFDVSLNVMSAFGFIIVLGIVVDDAIIVGENIYRHQEGHGDGMRGSIEGGQEIATPVIFAVLTTVAAFMPLMFVPGMMGKIFRVIPLIVIPCLLFSLVESLGILPAHLSHMKPQGKPGLWRRFQSLFSNGLKVFIRKFYEPFLEAAVRWLSLIHI